MTTPTVTVSRSRSTVNLDAAGATIQITFATPAAWRELGEEHIRRDALKLAHRVMTVALEDRSAVTSGAATADVRPT